MGLSGLFVRKSPCFPDSIGRFVTSAPGNKKPGTAAGLEWVRAG